MAELSPTFTCALTPQYNMTFERTISPSMTIALCTVNIIFALLASILNLFVMASIISTPKLQTPTFILLCNLALTDFAVGLVIGSIEVVYLITRALGLYSAFCTNWKVIVVLSYILCPASLYTVTSISYDRYLSLQMKVKYKTVVTKRKACVTVVVIWVWACLGVTLIGILGKTPFLILTSCVAFLCLGVIIDCYLLCAEAIKQHQKEIRSSTLLGDSKPKEQPEPLKESFRVNKGRKDDDVDFDDERFEDLDLKSDEGNCMGSEDESSRCHISIRNPKEDSRKRRFTTSSLNHVTQGKVFGGKNRHTLDPSALKYILVKKDIESVIEEVEIEERYLRQTELRDEDNDEEREEYNRNEKEKRDLNRENSIKRAENSRLTVKKAQLLADIKKFKQTLHTILMIVASLFILYLPYMVVSTLVNLRILNIGVAWDLAGFTQLGN